MEIKPVNARTYTPNFGVKFVTNDDFIDVISYAMKHNKSDKLITALENIGNKFKDTVVEMNICYTEDKPTLVFSRYIPGWNKTLKQPTGQYVLKRQVDYISEDAKINPLKFSLNKLIKMGQNRANNKMFDNIVVSKDEAKSRGFLF